MAQVRGSLSPGRAGTLALEGTLEAVESKGCPFHTRKHSEMDTAWPDVTGVRGQAVGTGTLLPGPLCFGGRRALTLGVPTGGGPQVVLGRRGLWEKAQMGCSSGKAYPYLPPPLPPTLLLRAVFVHLLCRTHAQTFAAQEIFVANQ